MNDATCASHIVYTGDKKATWGGGHVSGWCQAQESALFWVSVSLSEDRVIIQVTPSSRVVPLCPLYVRQCPTCWEGQVHCRQEPPAAQTQRLEASRTGSEQQGKPRQDAGLLWVENRKYRGFPKNSERGASLVAQWIRICLPMQETQVRSLVREDPTCCGATKPVHHNY